MNKNCFISWSGGKDSCMALYKAMQQGYVPQILLTMFGKESRVSFAHQLNKKIIKAQAAAIGIKSVIVETLFHEYENQFIETLEIFKEKNIHTGIFGDIDLEGHRQWVCNVCKKASLEAVLPLWQMDRVSLVNEFIVLGFKARIILVNTTMIGTEFLGEDLSLPLIQKLADCGVDVCGENGEYHTVVYDGPIFKTPLNIQYNNDIIPVGENWAKIDAFME